MNPWMAVAGEGPTLWTLIGRFHPATVHFPVALLSVAAFLEGWQILRRRSVLAPATIACTGLGLVFAVLATVMGWANASGRKHDDLLETHRWAGVATTAVALVAMFLVDRARTAQGGRKVLGARIALLVGMVLVGLTGHWGGELVFGDSYYRSGAPSWLAWFFKKKGDAQERSDPPPQGVISKVDFEKHIAPIIQTSCLKCHGDLKPKGMLRLNTKENAMKGKCIKPGDPNNSTFYTLLIDKDPDVRMPDKADPLPKSQVELVRQWIQEGASWPDGLVLQPVEK